MFKLMNLELRQNRLKTYISATLIISMTLLAFAYFFAFAPHAKIEASVFDNYEDIIGMTSILGVICFSIMSATMQAKFVVADYTSKRVNLIFSYPIERSKMLLAKVVLVFMFTLISQILCYMFVFGTFFLLDSVYPVVINGVLSSRLIINTVKITIALSIISAAISMIALFIGFNRKSIPSTIVSAFILSALFNNLIATLLIGKPLTQQSILIIITLSALILIIGIILNFFLMRKVNRMEV